MQLSTFPAPFTEDIVLSPLQFCFLYHRYLTMDFISVGLCMCFPSYSKIQMSIILLVQCSFNDYSFVVQSEVRELDSSSSIFIPQDCFGYSGSLCLHTNIEIFCSTVKNIIGNLIMTALNHKTSLGSIIILTVLSLLIQEDGISFHLFVSSLISFISILYFS